MTRVARRALRAETAMNTCDSLLLFFCALGAGFDIYDGRVVRGAFGVFACVAFAIVASVKR